MDENGVREYENEALNLLLETEDLAEKKARIYSKLLTDQSLEKEMEELALRHAKRRAGLELLLYGKTRKKQQNTEQTEKENEN